METTVATPFPKDELADLDQLRREQRASRAEAIRSAVRWYIRWADQLPPEDPIADEIDA